MGDFSFTHTRVIPAGAAEAAPVSPTDAIVFDLPSTLDARDGVRNDALYVLAQGANLAYEVGFWNATVSATASFVVIAAGTLVNGVPALVPFHADGARVYIRSTGVTAVDIRVSCAPVVSNPAAASAAAGLATEATLLSVDAELVSANASLTSVDGKLTTTNATLSTISGNVDGLENLLGQSEQGHVTIRTFNATVADATPPVAGSFIALTPQLGAFELHLTPAMTFAGTVKATQVVFTVWGRNSTSSVIYPIESFTETVARLELAAGTRAVLPRRYNAQVDEIFVTVAFLDGTSPTIATGTITARPIAQATFDDADFRRDPVTGNPVVQPTGYDGLFDALKTVVLNYLWPPLNEIGVISETSRASGSTYYWPADTGIDVEGYDTITFQYSITGATTSATSTTWQGTVDGVTWYDCTLGCVDVTTGATLSGAITTTAGGSSSKIIVVKDCQWAKSIRQAVAVTTANTGAVSCSIRRAKKGG